MRCKRILAGGFESSSIYCLYLFVKLQDPSIHGAFNGTVIICYNMLQYSYQCARSHYFFMAPNVYCSTLMGCLCHRD